MLCPLDMLVCLIHYYRTITDRNIYALRRNAILRCWLLVTSCDSTGDQIGLLVLELAEGTATWHLIVYICEI